MPIAVVCSGCGKQYKLADAAAGKRVKCRECGRDMLVPFPQSGPPAMPQEEEDPLEALARMEASAAPASPPPMSRRGPLIPQRPATLPPGDPLDLVDEPQYAKQKRRRPPGRFGRRAAGGPSTDSITPWLVIAFIVAQLAVAIVQSVQASHLHGPGHGKIIGLVWVVAVLHIVLLFALLGPAVYLGVWASSLLLNYRMIDLGYLRGCAIAAVPALLLLVTAFVPASFATEAMLATFLTIGLLLLVPVTYLLLRLVFDLDWVGGAVAYLLAAPIYIGAAAIAGQIIIAAVLTQAFGRDFGKPTGYFDRGQFALVPQEAEPTKPGNQPTNVPPAPPPTATIEAKKTQTADNLRQIGQSAQRFAGTSEKHEFPPSLEALSASGDLPVGCLNSPFNPSGQGGYFYYGSRSSQMPPAVVVAYDSAELTAAGGTHVLFANGNVEWRDTEQFNAAVALSTQSLTDWQQQQREAERRRQEQMANAAQANQLSAKPPVAPEPPKPVGFVATFDAAKSPFVATVAAVPIEGDFREIVRPVTTSPLALVVRSVSAAQDAVELWDLAAGQKKQDASFPHDAGFQSSYAINPTGTLLARTVNFPKLAVRIWSIKEGREGRLIPLDATLGRATLAGFLDAERLAVRRNRGSDEGLEIFNAFTAARAKTVPFAAYTRSATNGVFSPDGHLYALTTGQVRGRPGMEPVAHLELYDLASGPGRRWREVPDIATAQADAPAGMAFSPDGHKVAALFARNGAGYVIIWRVADTRAIGQYEVALAPAGGDAGAAAQSGLVWVHNGSALLVGGNTLLDANSGKTLGQLNAPPSTEQWSLGAENLAFNFTDDGKPRLAHVKLDDARFTAGPTTSPAAAPAGH